MDSIYDKFTANPDLEEESTLLDSHETTSIFSKISSAISSKSQAINFGEKSQLIKSKASELQSEAKVFSTGMMEKYYSGPNYPAATICFVVGMLFLLITVSSLPMLLIAPGKFNFTFGIASSFLNLALAFWQGPSTYLNRVVIESNRVIVAVYFLTLFLAIYSAFFW